MARGVGSVWAVRGRQEMLARGPDRLWILCFRLTSDETGSCEGSETVPMHSCKPRRFSQA